MENEITGNEPANPIVIDNSDFTKGLTIRQEFARSAMQGILAKESFVERLAYEGGNHFANDIAKAAINVADELIAELNKEK